MTQINLLPWRSEVLKLRNYQFYAWIFCAVVIGFLLCGAIYCFVNYLINVELENIQFLETEQQEITSKIIEIKDLQKSKEDLLYRRDIIQSLQTNRSLLVKVLDALPRATPEGILITSMIKKGSQLTLVGTAQTNASISTFLKNLQDEQWKHLFSDIKLNEITTDKKSTELGFKLEFVLASVDVATPSTE